MKIKFIVPMLVIFALLGNSTISLAAQAGDPNRQWAEVRATPTGNKLSLRLKDGKKMEGRLVNISDTALTIDRGRQTSDVTRDSIEKVYRVEPKSRGKSVAKGALRTGRTIIGLEVAVFEEGETAIDFVAEGATEFVLGSAVKHPHDLVTGYYSVHTSAAALEKGESEIQRIDDQLRAAKLL